MVKLIGLLLIISSLISLAVGGIIDWKYSDNPQVTGKVVSIRATGPEAKMGLFDYAEAIALSYAVVSFIAGMIFLFRM